MEQQLINAFNLQINRHFFNSYQYFAMSVYLNNIMMEGFSKYMKHKASIEIDYAQKMCDYLILRNEKTFFQKISQPNYNWVNVSNIFLTVLSIEQTSFNDLKNIYNIALKINDVAALHCISELINRKNKDVETAKKFILKFSKSDTVKMLAVF